MHENFDYTSTVRRFALKHPVFNHVAIQVNFWIFAFILLAAIIHLNTLTMIESYSLQIPTSFGSSVTMAIIGGLVYGITIGLVDIWTENGSWKNRSLGIIVLVRVLVYLVIIIGLTAFVRYVFWEKIILNMFFEKQMLLSDHITWGYFFHILLIYTLMMSGVINFINIMNKKFGPGVLLPMLLGKYRNPREEKRIFMFMDLQSSTTLAEKLGHIKYSALIRDSFIDINRVLLKFHAEIYQYVGDEIVISWPISAKLNTISCIEFFFAVQHQFTNRTSYYMDQYGIVPVFKAGLHLGTVTVVEVGEIKRDIAYHGDTLNTASRIQSLCNKYDKMFLVSRDIKEFINFNNTYDVELIGSINLKGKQESVEVFSIEQKSK